MNDRILDPTAILLILGLLVFSGPTVRLIKRAKFTILDILILFIVVIAMLVILIPK